MPRETGEPNVPRVHSRVLAGCCHTFVVLWYNIAIMMNTLSSRLSSAGLVVAAAIIAPVAVFAQDTATAMAVDNSSGWIGGLIIWLLPVGGLLAFGVMSATDKRAQAGRSARR